MTFPAALKTIDIVSGAVKFGHLRTRGVFRSSPRNETSFNNQLWGFGFVRFIRDPFASPPVGISATQ